MNIFEERNFNVDDRNKLKNVIESVIVAMEEIKDLTDSMNDDIKSRCEALNEGIDDKDLMIKPALIKKMAKSKMKNKEDFVIVFTQSWCAHCEKFRDMLDEYLPKHHVIVYDVVIDKDPNPDRSGNIKKIQSYFKTMDSTPSLYYVEKGKVKDELENGDDGITKEKFDSWVQNFKLDEKK